jgi:hypothetical protein
MTFLMWLWRSWFLLLGWHWEFLPAFVAEVIPGVELVPSWTFAVLEPTRTQRELHSDQFQND